MKNVYWLLIILVLATVLLAQTLLRPPQTCPLPPVQEIPKGAPV